MDTDRRSVLKASGVAALLSTTGLAGCSGLLGGGGGGGAASWQYDPAKLKETENKFFGSADLAELYEVRQELPEDVSGGIEETEDSPIQPEDLELASGVGAVSISMSGGSSDGFGSFAVTGSFSASDITDEVEQSEDAQSAGEYEGYSLWKNAGDSISAGGMTGESSSVIGVTDGTMVVGAAGANEGSASVTGEEAAKTMIDAGSGNVELLADNNEFIQTLSNNLGSGTIQFGGTLDPALIEAFSGMSGSQFTSGFRAAGANMMIEGETTTITGAGVYTDSDAAEDTGIVTIVDGFSEELTQQEGFDSLEAEYSDATVIVTMEGDTETLFEQGAGQAPVGPGGGI